MGTRRSRDARSQVILRGEKKKKKREPLHEQLHGDRTKHRGPSFLEGTPV